MRPLPLIISLLLGLGTLAPAADAHGPVPAALGVAALDDDGAPWLIRLSEGLGFREAGGAWRYGCAQAWHLPVTPLVAQVSVDQIWLVGTDHLHSIHPEGLPLPWTGAAPSADQTLRLTATAPGVVIATARVDGRTALWRLTAQTVTLLAELDSPWRGFAVFDGQFHLVRVDGATVLHASLTTEGLWIGEASIDGVDGTGQTPDLHATGDGLFLILRSTQQTRLWRLFPEPDLLWQGGDQLLGPVTLGGDPDDVLLGSGGALYRVQGGESTLVHESPLITCLAPGHGNPYACHLRTVVSVDGQTGALGETLFDVGSILPPDPARVDPELWPACELDWFDFAADGDLDPYGTSPAEPAAGADGGCHAVTSVAPPTFALVVLLGWRLRRSCRRGHP